MNFLSCGVLIFLAATPAMATDYCPPGTSYKDRYSDKGDTGNYKYGYTSGYSETGQGDYLFIYCIKNLSDQTPFEFKWKGPRPSTLLKGKVAYGQDYTEGWQSSSTPPDKRAERILFLGNGGQYKDVKIETIFKKAEYDPRPRVSLAQDKKVPLELGSWAGFLNSLRQVPPQGGMFRRISGITFSIPSDPKEWGNYIASTDQMAKSRPIRVRAFFGVTYDIETMKMTLIRGLGFSEKGPAAANIQLYLKAFRMDYPGLKTAGFEGEASTFGSAKSIVPIGTTASGMTNFIGEEQTTTLGSLAPYVSDERTVRRVEVPVILKLNGQPIFEFPIELLGLPQDAL